MRYFFDVETPNGRAFDREGTEYYSRDDMRSGAIRLLLEIARNEAINDLCEVSLSVRDTSGLTVSTIKLNMTQVLSSVH